MKKINLLLIDNSHLKKYFSNKFNVFEFKLNDSLQISEVCKKLNIDVILQVENLSKRDIILDINEINCLKIFWAIDIHLNYYWQEHYFKNFDIILTTQKRYVDIWNKNNIYWIPWGIPDEYISKNFNPFSKRQYKISFVGLIDKNRIKRRLIIDKINKHFSINTFGTTLNNRLSFNDMLKIYRNSQIVINESINSDVNFRYFEVTSQGALLYSEKINNGENFLFKDKLEAIYFSQLNLVSRLKYFLKNPNKIEQIAYKGWEKTKQYHKLSDRIRAIEKIILKNLKNYKIRGKNISYPLLLTYLRGIGKPDYLKNIDDLILKTISLKLYDKSLFITNSKKLYSNDLIEVNIIIENLKSFEEAKKILKEKFKKIPLYYTGYINVANNNIIFTIYEFINFIMEKFPEKAQKDKYINYIGGKILFEHSNFQGAIIHFLNLVREFPENTLFRKFLSSCYFMLYKLDLFYREILKIYLLEKKFSDFRKFKIDDTTKKEVIFEIISTIKNKKLLRDIIFNLSDFYESYT